MTGFFSIHAPHPAKNLYGSQSINFYIVKIQIFGSKFWSAPLSTGPRPREESGAETKSADVTRVTVRHNTMDGVSSGDPAAYIHVVQLL